MHAYAMKDPVFFSGWNAETGEQYKRPDTGERFCIQCHSPVALLTGTNLEGYTNAEDMADSDLPEVITEGVGCDVCHSMTDLSPTIHTQNEVAATAEYYMNPGKGLKYGNIKNPVHNNFHDSEYNPIYSSSEVCLPCHNLTIRGVEAEITYSEWDRISSTAMGLFSCQGCHMPLVTRPAADGCPDGCPDREVHSHTFVGVDLNLSMPAEDNPQYEIVTELLKNAVTLAFGTPYDESVSIDGDSLIIPVTVTSQTAHSIPSGVSFAREAWLEVMVTDNENNILYQSGVVSDTTSLDISDSDLLLFTAYLIDADGKTTGSVTDVSSIINNSLMAFSDRYKVYKVKIPTNITGEIKIQARMRFRSFKPNILRVSHQNLLENLPIFDMAEDSATVTVPQ